MEYLGKLHQIQNKIYTDFTTDNERQQNFLYFLSNHPTIFNEFDGYLTIAEAEYIIRHFNDYTVDPRTFENEFKRLMWEHLPQYNLLKGKELADEVLELVDDKYKKTLINNKISQLSSNGLKETNGTTNDTTSNKRADRQLPMQTTGTNFEGVVNWSNGASTIGENKDTRQSTLKNTDSTTLTNWGKDDVLGEENYEHHGNPVEHMEQIWNYIVKPKSINWLCANISIAFNLIY